jgi:predicted RNA-binding protein with PIN domain
MSTPAEHVIVVDAANVIGSRPDGWWRDRPGAARRLLLKLATLQHHLPHTTIVVILEGAARAAVPTPNLDPLRVVLAPASGDDTITEITAEALAPQPPPTVTVVTADRTLRHRVEPLGATTTGPTWLWTQLDNL